ncbi:MAG: hypothetical protein EHM67_14450, partial [Hyphomicrobiaceae bacterium]
MGARQSLQILHKGCAPSGWPPEDGKPATPSAPVWRLGEKTRARYCRPTDGSRRCEGQMCWRAVGAVIGLSWALLGHPDAGSAQERQCSSARTKIVGGENARLPDWPGIASLRLHSDTGQVSRYFCGAAAISERWILTAAHCLPDYVAQLTNPLRNSRGEDHEGRLEVVLGVGDL